MHPENLKPLKSKTENLKFWQFGPISRVPGGAKWVIKAPDDNIGEQVGWREANLGAALPHVGSLEGKADAQGSTTDFDLA